MGRLVAVTKLTVIWVGFLGKGDTNRGADDEETESERVRLDREACKQEDDWSAFDDRELPFVFSVVPDNAEMLFAAMVVF